MGINWKLVGEGLLVSFLVLGVVIVAVGIYLGLIAALTYITGSTFFGLFGSLVIGLISLITFAYYKDNM